MSFVIRVAYPRDAKDMAKVHCTSWQETYTGLIPNAYLDNMIGEQALDRRTTHWIRFTQDEKQVVLVAEQNSQIVAFASGGPTREHPGYDCELYTLYSYQAVQGQGIGRTLLTNLAQRLAIRGYQKMALWVLDSNPTKAWYAHQGAYEAGHRHTSIPQGKLFETRMVWDDLQTLIQNQKMSCLVTPV